MCRMTKISLITLSVLFVGTSLNAATIFVDLGPDAQETSLASWNDYSAVAGATTFPAGSLSLNNSTGSDSGIDLSVSETGSSGFNGLGASYAGPYPAEVSGYPANSVLDGVYTIGGTITATLSNLNPEGTYNFLIYGADGNDSSPGVAATWTVTGFNVGSDTISATHDNSTEVALIEGIIPDGSNQISIVMSSPGIGRWNTLQITEFLPVPIPEPSSCLLLGLGALGLLRCSRRRRLAA